MPEEQEEQNQEQPTPRRIPLRRLSPDYVKIYANQSEFALTPWDLQIQLGFVHGEGAGLVIEEVASLAMSPQHAKAFALAVITNVKLWEQTYGEIKLPRQILAKAVGEVNLPPETESEGESEGAGEADEPNSE